jgi:hypothetical protein
MTTTGSITPGGNNEKLYMYASIFLYKPKTRIDYNGYVVSIQSYEGKA